VTEYDSARCRNRRGNPYPLVRDFCVRRNRETGALVEPHPLWRLTNAFMRNYAIICVGDSGWRNHGFTGLKPTPTEKQFFLAFDERGIEAD
jgi:hypothetical protein